MLHPQRCEGLRNSRGLAQLKLTSRQPDFWLNFNLQYARFGYAVAQLVEALSYTPEGRGLDSRWGH